MALRIFFSIWFVIGLTLVLGPTGLTITYTEEQSDLETLQLAGYRDGTTVIRLAAKDPNRNNCWTSDLILRLIRPDGSVTKIPTINYTFPDFNFCPVNFNSSGINIYAIGTNNLLIRFVKVQNETTLEGAEIQGLIVDWNGNIIIE